MNYIFYKIYVGTLKIRKNANPELRASFAFLMIQIFNLIAIEKLFMKYFGSNYNLKEIPDEIKVLVGIVLSIINYFMFISKNKYLIVIDKFKNENALAKKRGNIITITYILFSILLLVYVKFVLTGTTVSK